MSRSLYNTYRPVNFDEVIGNESTVQSLQKMFEREEGIPNAILLHGPSGTGKTTVARIIKNLLEIADQDYKELDLASTRGIDNIRDLREKCKYKPLRSKYRMYLMDECFAAGTQIETPNGAKAIESFVAGDSVYSSNGVDIVTNTFVKEIPLDRLIRVEMENGKTLFCSDKHEVFTEKGWKNSEDLVTGDLLLPFCCDLVSSTNQENREKNNGIHKKSTNETLRCLRKTDEGLSQRGRKRLLQPEMQRQSKREAADNGSVRMVRGGLYRDCSGEKGTVLHMQQILCSPIQGLSSGRKEKPHRRSTKSYVGKSESLQQNTGRIKSSETFLRKDVTKEPVQRPACGRKNKRNEKAEWDFKCLAGKTRGQRAINHTTKTAGSNSGKFVGNGIQHIIGSSKRWVPNKLQGGYSSSEAKNSCGSRREQPQTPEQYRKRFEENKETSRIRVASVARYERGNNDQLFSSVVKGKEVRQGFINLYDLEVKSIPNYFANGVLVHNCHQVTAQAQEAMLKWLEDCPKHVIIVLATTDPQKLIKTILTRCNKFQLNLLSREEMRVLIEWVLDNEDIQLPKKVVSEIIVKSEGSPRNALTLLDNVIEIEDEDTALEILAGDTGEGSKETIDLCRLLMDSRATWKQYQSLLAAIKDEPETVRYSVLGFCNSVALREKDEKKIKRAVAVMECFSKNYYDSKKAGLTYSCFEAYYGIDV